MNKKELLQTIIDNYDNISDTEYEPKTNKHNDFLTNTDKEHHIMEHLWEQFINHLYVRDYMLFSHAYVYDNKVYLHFTDVIDGEDDIEYPNEFINVPDIHITENMTPEELTFIKINLLRQNKKEPK